MIGCDSDEERQLALGRPLSTDQVSRSREAAGRDHRSLQMASVLVPSPISRLSADVLCFILKLYCQVELPVNFPLGSRPPQFIASQVCSEWRQIILDNPIFWNKIRFTFDKGTRYYDKMVETPHLWLSRARNLPCFIDSDFRLSHKLKMLHCHPLWRHDINKNIVRDLIALHKCKSLGVVFADNHLHDLLELPDEKLSCIEDLRLYHIHEADNHETISLLDFHRLTNLTSFSLDTVLLHRPSLLPDTELEFQYFQVFSGIPWHQLCHIHLEPSLTVLRCLTILEASSSILETCSFVVYEHLSIATLPLSQITPIHCQRLREVEFYIVSSATLDAGDSFLLLLRLPKLKSLTLQYPNWYLDDLQTLFRRWSVCTMHPEKLIISGRMCKVDAGALLESMPSLRCLELPRHSIFTVDVIRKLGIGSLGPFLEELTIKITAEIGELLQMVKTRSSTEKENSALQIKPTPLKTVRLYCDDPDGSLPREYDAIIDEINQLGVKLTVTVLDPDSEPGDR